MAVRGTTPSGLLDLSDLPGPPGALGCTSPDVLTRVFGQLVLRGAVVGRSLWW